MTKPTYHTRYGYPLWIAYVAEFWWRVEHLPHPVGRYDGLCGWLRSLGYKQRKAWEQRGYDARG